MAGPRIDVEAWEKQVRHVPAKVLEVLCDSWTYKLRNDIAVEWGFPLVGETIDLIAVLRWLREFLKQQAPLLRILKEDGEEGPLGVEYLRAKIRKAVADGAGKELLNAQKEGRLLDREMVRGIFEIIASMMVQAGSAAQKKWGSDGLDFFNELLDRMELAIRGLMDADDATEGGDMEANGDDQADISE